MALVSSAALMVPMFLAGPLELDEHGSYWVIDSGLPGTSLTRSLDYAAIPPLSGWMQQVSIAVLGKTEVAFRLPSAVAYLAALLVVYLVGAELRGPAVGGLAALLLAWHPEAMDEVRIARCYGLVLLMSALLVLASVRWLRTPDSLGRAVLWGLTSAGLMWTHYTSALLVGISGLWIGVSFLLTRPGLSVLQSRTDVVKERSAHEAGRGVPSLFCFAVGMGLTVVLCLPLLAPVFRLQEWGPFLNYSADDVSVWSVLGPLWWLGVPSGLLLNEAMNFRTRTPRAVPLGSTGFLAVAALVPLAVLALLSMGELSSLSNPRYRVAIAPPAACLIALVFASRGTLRTAVFASAVLLAAAWGAAPLRPWDTGRLGSASAVEWRDVAVHLAQRAHPDEPILVQSGLTESHLVPVFADDPLFMEYVACRVSRFYLEETHARYALPFLWDERSGINDFYRELLATLAARDDAGFWVAAATDTDLNRNSLAGIQRIASEAGFSAVEEQVWPTVTLIHYVGQHGRSG